MGTIPVAPTNVESDFLGWNVGDRDVYLCGPPPMVDAVRKYFDDNGVKPNSFHYEKFTPNAAPRTA